MSLPKLAIRELSRGFGRLVVPGVCVAVAVASQASVGVFNGRVNRAMDDEAQAMAGADLEISGPKALEGDELAKAIAALPASVRSTRVREFVSMAAHPADGRTRLVEVRVVGDGFPFYGGLETDPPLPMTDLDSEEPTLFAQPEIFPQLGVAVGGTVRLGELDFKIKTFVRKEPGPGGAAFALGPRIWFHEKFLPKTGLNQRGSRVRHRTLFAFADTDEISVSQRQLAAAKERVDEALTDPAFRVRTYQESNQQLRSFYRRLDDFLSLLSLLVFLLAGVGVMNAVRSHLRTRVGAVAIMRCYGASRSQVLFFFLLQALALGTAGSLIGVASGLALSQLIPRMLADLIDLPVEGLPPLLPVLGAFATGIVSTLLFSIISLVELPSIRPGLLLRAEPIPQKPTWMRALASGAVLAFFAGLASIQSGSAVTGFGIVAAVAGAAAALYFFFYALVRALSLSDAAIAWLPFIPRYGLRNFFRTRGQAAITLSVLSLGALLIGSVSLIRAGMLAELSSASSPDRPELFMIDVGEDQKAPLEASLLEVGGLKLTWAKLIRARLTSVNDAAVTRRAENESRSREFNLSERESLYDTERLLKGRFWDGPKSPEPGPDGVIEIEASLESGFAERMEARMGDRLDFEIQGLPIRARVVSIREVKWATFQPNFFVLLRPGALEGAPFTWIGSIAGARGEAKTRIQESLVKSFSSVTVIDVEEAGARLLRIAGRIEQVIRFLSAFALLAGLSVMALIALDNAERRSRETALLKVLGGTRAQLLRAVAAEFSLVGALAALSGWLGSIVMTRGFVASRFGIDTPAWTAELILLLLALAAGVVILGILSSARAFRSRPVLILKSE